MTYRCDISDASRYGRAAAFSGLVLGALGFAACASVPVPPSTAGPRSMASSTTQVSPGASDAPGTTDAQTADAGLPEVRPMRLGADANVPALLVTAQAAFDNRGELAQLKLAIAQWERVHAIEPDNAAVALHLSRAYFLLGDGFYRAAADTTPSIMHDAFERGTLAGEQALMLLSPGVAKKLAEGRPVEEALLACDKVGLEAMAWYAQNLTAFAVARGIPTMLLYRKRVQTLVEQMILRDEAVLYGAPYRVRGTFLAAAPSFAGGSLPQAQSAFLRAQMLAPRYLPNGLALAELWAVQAADKASFVQTLSAVAKAETARPVDVAPEQQLAQKRAAWLLTQVNRLF